MSPGVLYLARLRQQGIMAASFAIKALKRLEIPVGKQPLEGSSTASSHSFYSFQVTITVFEILNFLYLVLKRAFSTCTAFCHIAKLERIRVKFFYWVQELAQKGSFCTFEVKDTPSSSSPLVLRCPDHCIWLPLHLFTRPGTAHSMDFVRSQNP